MTKTALYVMLNANGKRAKYAQIAKSTDNELNFYDIWALDSDIENNQFLPPVNSIGAIYQARITKLDPKTNLAFLTLGHFDAVMKLKPKQKFNEGQYILAEITSEAYADKSLRVRFVGDVKHGDKHKPSLYRPAPNLAEYCLSLADDGCEIICDDFAFFAALKNLPKIRHLAINLKPVMHKIKHGLFEVHNLAEQVAELYERQVALDNGGNFIIEQTTAMTVVDVNSGQYIGSDPAKMVDIINIAAADKICKQLSLRKISGLVVIDFLKYAKKAERLKFSEYLLKLAKVYKFELGSLTNFGLAEFKISRTTKNIDEKILDMT